MLLGNALCCFLTRQHFKGVPALLKNPAPPLHGPPCRRNEQRGREAVEKVIADSGNQDVHLKARAAPPPTLRFLRSAEEISEQQGLSSTCDSIPAR